MSEKKLSLSCERIKESILNWVEANTLCWKIKDGLYEVYTPIFTENRRPVPVIIEVDKYANSIKIHDGGFVAVTLATFFEFSRLEEFLEGAENRKKFVNLLKKRVKGLNIANNTVFLNINCKRTFVVIYGNII